MSDDGSDDGFGLGSSVFSALSHLSSSGSKKPTRPAQEYGQTRPQYYYALPHQQVLQNQPIPPPSEGLGYGEQQAHHGHSPYQQAPAPPPGPAGYDFQQITILDDSMRVTPTNQILYDISRPDQKSRFSLSPEKSVITIGRSDTGHPLGTIRAHSMSEDVDMTMYGQATVIKTDLMGEGWYYRSIAGSGSKFWWSDDDSLGLGDGKKLTLKDAKKHGRIIAQKKNNVLTFQVLGLGQAMMDEVMVSAVAMNEVMKNKKKGEQMIAKIALKAVLGAS